jgi:hypothetical protein
VRIGCVVLGTLGLLNLFLGARTAADPDGAQCGQARATLEDEDEVEDGSDVPCDDAVAQVNDLAASNDDVDEVTTEGTIRTFGLVIAFIGLVQAGGALATARIRSKAARLVALVGAAAGILFSTLGILGIPILGFVVYAIFFSADARAVFGDPGGPRMFRPRTAP